MTKTVSDNINIYWAGATGLAIWFLFIHSPPIILQRSFFGDPLFYLHLIGAYGLYLACIHNSLLTPSISFARLPHIWVGRVGLVLGVVDFVIGAYLAMWRYISIDTTFAIFITIGGFFQMFLQYSGYKAIRRYQVLKEQIKELEEQTAGTPPEDASLLQDLIDERDACLKKHIGSMISLFVAACGIPAIIRISDNTAVMITLVSFMNLITILYGKTMTGSIGQQRDGYGDSNSSGAMTPLVGS